MVDIPSPVAEDLQRRVARAEGQLRGIQRMLDDARDCREVVAQLSAVEGAVHRARVRLITAGIRFCATDPALAPDAEEFEQLLLRTG